MAVERLGRIVDVVEHAADTRSLFLVADDGEPLAFRAGQFLSCLVPIGGDLLTRPYSIASAPGEPRLELLLNLDPGGPGSHRLFQLRVGDTLRFTGPWGTFTIDDPPAVETVFVAEQTGIAPIRSILLDLVRRPQRPPLRLLYGTTLAIYRDELAALPGLTLDIVAPERVFDEAAHRYVEVDRDRTRHIFICGVGAPVLALRDRLRAAGYPRRAVQYERW